MSNNAPDDSHRLNFIAATVETMRDQMAAMHEQMATMQDQMVTKSDLEGMATKRDLEGMATKTDLEGLATESELSALSDQVAYIGGQVETMRDQMATKSDVTRLGDKVEAEFAAVRGDIEQVQLRLDSIERALRARLGQIEAEVSRLRSVIYLLVKDQPEMLRLLGQPPSLNDEGRT